MTYQEIYNRVKSHLLTQNEKAVDENGDCVYKGSQGKMCAIGCLIPPEIYSSHMEGIEITDSYFENFIIEVLELNPGYTKHVQFLNELQSIHDQKEPEQWFDELTSLANRYKLIP